MEITVLGLNYKSAPIQLRERLAIPGHRTQEFLEVLSRTAAFRERVIVSTCNRTEIYGLCENFEQAIAETKVCLGRFSHLDISDFEPSLYALRQPDSVRHLFSVASGLDSMVLGETEIIGQVKDAYLAAHQNRHTGKVLNTLFQRSLKVAKHVRSNTEIGTGKVSVASVAVDLAEKIFNDLKNKRVIILGTGQMAIQVAKAMISKGALPFLVSRAHQERAEDIAKELGAQAVAYDAYADHMKNADILIASTLAPRAIVLEPRVRAWMKERHDKPLFMIDIAVPRNIENSCEKIDNVYLYNVDDLEAIADNNKRVRENELQKCLELISHQTHHFMSWLGKEFGSTPNGQSKLAACDRNLPT